MNKVLIFTDLIFNYEDDDILDFINDTYLWFKDRKDKILDFYGALDFRVVTVNVFTNRDSFEKFLLSFYEDKNTKIPSYCKGTFHGEMINVYFNKDDILNNNDKNDKYNSLLGTITHEYIHLVYKECIREKYNLNRLTWLDEGLANYLSDSMIARKFNHIGELRNVKVKLLESGFTLDKIDINKINFNTINSNALYVLSYTAVKYLFDTNQVDLLKEIMITNNASLSKNLLVESANYYLK